jgi:hypothetical protein
VFASGLHATAQSLFYAADAISQYGGRDHEMIELAVGDNHGEFLATISASV